MQQQTVPITANQPCRVCGCPEYVMCPNVRIEISVEGRSGGGDANPDCTMITCRQCGKTDWFAINVEALRSRKDAVTIRADQSPPYR
jgi:hypothetical protein